MKFQFSVNVLLGIILFGCHPISERKQPRLTLEQLAATDLKINGEQLANAYCGSCHLKPDPSILDQKTWVENVLPDMRKRLGLYLEEDFGVDLPEDSGVPKGIYSKVQLIQRDDWQKILEYYQENAPESPLPQLAKKLPKKGIPGFELIQPEYDFIYPNLITMVRIHPETGQLWIGNRFRKVFVLDPKRNFQLLDSITTSIAPVEILWNSDSEFELLTMGLMDPSNDSIGSITRYTRMERRWTPAIIKDSLRPVHFLNDGESNFKESWFYPMHGASGIELDDFDGDGDLDLFVIAFFPDPIQSSRQDLIYFRQESDGDFSPFVLARGIDSNRFTITKGDLDLDGDQDVVIGTFQFNDLYKGPVDNWKPVIVLKNLNK